MAAQGFQYDRMMDAALRGVMRDALARAAERGLPGDHHFYITFQTAHPGVQVPATPTHGHHEAPPSNVTS